MADIVSSLKLDLTKDFFKPFFLAIEITNRCNLNCTMCFKRGLENQPSKHMSFEEFKTILDNVSPILGLNFIGLGEPLLNPDFKKMLEETRRRRLGVNFATNGMLLTEDWAKTLIDLQIDKVTISIDATTKEAYENIRRGSNFELVKENVKRFTRLRKEANSTLPNITSAMTLSVSNIKELPDMVDLGEELGVSGISTLYIQALTKELEKEHLHNTPTEEVIKCYNKALEKARKHNISLFLKHPTPKCLECKTPWINPYIDVYGDLYSCCLPGTEKVNVTEYYKDAPVKVNNRNLCFGNVFKQSFHDIWNGKEFNNYRKDCLKIFKEDENKEWTLESYLQLRKDNPDPKNYCKVCGVRFSVIC